MRQTSLYSLIAFNLISTTFSLGVDAAGADRFSVGMASADVDVDVEVDAYRAGPTALATEGLANTRSPVSCESDRRIITPLLALVLRRGICLD